MIYYMYAASCFAHKQGPLLSPSFIWLGSTPVSGDHGEGQVLAVLALDRGDKSLSTPEDSLPVGKLGTSLSRPCHTLPCRSSLIGPALWRAQPYFCHHQRSLRSVSQSRRGEERRNLMLNSKDFKRKWEIFTSIASTWEDLP